MVFLEYEDGTLGQNIEEAVKTVGDILNALKPFAIFFPGKQDKHRDHKAAHTIVQKAVQTINLQPQLYEYVIWRTGLRTDSNRHPVSFDISEVLPIKRAAMAEYKSQTTLFTKDQKRPILIKRFLNRFMQPSEVFSIDDKFSRDNRSKIGL